jgi:hypothetical protein
LLPGHQPQFSGQASLYLTSDLLPHRRRQSPVTNRSEQPPQGVLGCDLCQPLAAAVQQRAGSSELGRHA